MLLTINGIVFFMKLVKCNACLATTVGTDGLVFWHQGIGSHIISKYQCISRCLWVNTMRPNQNGCCIADDIFKCFILKEGFDCKFVQRVQLILSQHWFRSWFGTKQQAITLTHWHRDKMAAIFQTTFSNGFSWMKMYEFHWSLFLGVQLTIFQHWFR